MKRIHFIGILIIVALLGFGGTVTYSYYIDQADALVDLNIASWIVKVNSTDITLEDSHTFTIDELNYSANANVNNKLAPGVTGNFTMGVDLTDVDTAIEYDLELDESVFNNPNIHISNVTATRGSISRVTNEDPTSKIVKYHGYLSLNNVVNGKTFTIRVYVKWDNNDDYNDIDTETGSIANTVIDLPVNITISQYVG